MCPSVHGLDGGGARQLTGLSRDALPFLERWLQRARLESQDTWVGPVPVQLNQERVPSELRHLLGIVQILGIADDGYRLAAFEQIPPGLAKTMVQIVNEVDDALDLWLGGPEAELREPSLEYLAFAAFRISVDAL